MACTVPPLKAAPEVFAQVVLFVLPVDVGVGLTTIVTVAVDPDCREIGPQLTPPPVELAPVHVPEVMLAETKVSGTIVAAALRLSVTVIPLARSGPLFVSV
jgi:hypothetical protein